MIRAGDPKLYRAYCLKESLRLLLKSTDVRQAEADLKHWLWGYRLSMIFIKRSGAIRSTF